MTDRRNLGEVREALGKPKLFGVMDAARLHDSRNIVVQIQVGETEFGIIYEYRTVRAVGSLFFDGEFTAVIAAGEIL